MDDDGPSDERVPVSYAEKAMSSLLRLHDDLVEEKEKRIDLYRRLMDREQELAELRAYVRLLEGEIERSRALPAQAAPRLGRGAEEAGEPAPHEANHRAAEQPAEEAAEPPLAKAAGAESSDPWTPPAPRTPAPAATTPGSGRAPVVAWVPLNAARRGRGG